MLVCFQWVGVNFNALRNNWRDVGNKDYWVLLLQLFQLLLHFKTLLLLSLGRVIRLPLIFWRIWKILTAFTLSVLIIQWYGFVLWLHRLTLQFLRIVFPLIQRVQILLSFLFWLVYFLFQRTFTEKCNCSNCLIHVLRIRLHWLAHFLFNPRTKRPGLFPKPLLSSVVWSCCMVLSVVGYLAVGKGMVVFTQWFIQFRYFSVQKVHVQRVWYWAFHG